VPLLSHRNSAYFVGIQIRGDAAFRARTWEALQLLRSQSCFEIVQGHIALIQQGRRSGMKAWTRRPTFVVGKPTWQHSVLWYAGAIAHDAYHSKLYQEAKRTNGGERPGAGTWTGANAERQCLKFQRQVLTGLNAEPTMLAYIDQQLQNPVYRGRNQGWRAWLDYLQRWW
jgi:hypothetical protein